MTSTDKRWIVVCRDRLPGTRYSPYVLATRTVFREHSMAVTYASTIAKSRKAIVVLCPLGVELRDDAEERFAAIF